MNALQPIPPLERVAVQVRFPDNRYAKLHLLCATGKATVDELAELDLMEAMKVEEDSNV